MCPGPFPLKHGLGGMMQAEGYPEEVNQTGDVLATITDAEDDMQLFWEALPAEGASTAKTTYAFAYCDSDKARPDLAVRIPTLSVVLARLADAPQDKKGRHGPLAVDAWPGSLLLQPRWGQGREGEAMQLQYKICFGGQLGTYLTTDSMVLPGDLLWLARL